MATGIEVLHALFAHIAERHQWAGRVFGVHGGHVRDYGRPTYLKSQIWIS
jgi:hypothetical protein